MYRKRYANYPLFRFSNISFLNIFIHEECFLIIHLASTQLYLDDNNVYANIVIMHIQPHICFLEQQIK